MNAMLKKPEIRTIALSELKPAVYNPRKITDKAKKGLSESLNKFGVVQPIVWNEQTKNIVGGHQRYYCLLEAGAVETEVMVVDLSIDQEKLLAIALNNEKTEGEWSMGVTELLETIEKSTPELYDSLNFNDLYNAVAPKIPIAPKSKKSTSPASTPIVCEGDVWILGRHKLLCGSGRHLQNVNKLMEDKKADMMMTSLCSKEILKRAKFKSVDMRLFYQDVLKSAPLRNTNVYVILSERDMADFLTAARVVNLTSGAWLAWVTDECSKAKQIFYGWAGNHVFHGLKSSSVFDYERPSKNPLFKPQEMLEKMIKDGSPKDGIVYDPFAGYGCVLFACESAGRECRAMEYETVNCEVILNTWVSKTHSDAIRKSDGAKWTDLKKGTKL